MTSKWIGTLSRNSTGNKWWGLCLSRTQTVKNLRVSFQNLTLDDFLDEDLHFFYIFPFVYNLFQIPIIKSIFFLKTHSIIRLSIPFLNKIDSFLNIFENKELKPKKIKR